METNVTPQAEQVASQPTPQTDPVSVPPIGDQIKTPSPKNPIKLIAAVVILAIIVVGGVVLNWNYIRVIFLNPNKQTAQSTKSQPSTTTPTKAVSQVETGEKTITVKPGQTDLTLVDGDTRILFGNSGSSNAVPDVVFGDRYSLNDIHKVNYLPIRKEVSFYNNGYFITLKNLGCKTETGFTDVSEVWVTECSIQTKSKQEQAPLKPFTSFGKEINTSTLFNGSVTNTPNNLLIYLIMPRLSIQNFSTKLLSENVSLESGSMTSYSADTPWDIRLVTGYGIDTIRYTAQEIWNKESKEITIGSLKVTTTIKHLDCKVIYTGTTGEQTQRCNNILVDFSFTQEANNQTPVKLVSYLG